LWGGGGGGQERFVPKSPFCDTQKLTLQNLKN
jgi:hypothetical protein